jgi:DNA processing protein
MLEKPCVSQRLPGSVGYPAAVANALGDKAPAITMMGNTDLLESPAIGFCGSRKASARGLETAADCAEQAAEAGFAVVSGNAAGVDFVAHHAALKVGGATILVLPEGIDHFRIRKDLRAVWDWTRVLVISQFEAAALWRAGRAMARNQIIIALSQAMIVIEAGATGGTLNAGLSTLAAGKPLFVARYERVDVNALGNAILLDRGGLPLSRSRSTGRANLKDVQDVTAHAVTAASARSLENRQLRLL